MRTFYTNKGNEVYVDESEAHRVEGKELKEVKGGEDIRIRTESGFIELGKYIKDTSKVVIRKDKDKFLYTDDNLQVFDRPRDVFGVIPYTGVSAQKVRDTVYAVSYYYDKDCSRVTLGYYYTPYEAAVVREYTIRSQKIPAEATGIDLNDTELEEEYNKIISKVAEKKQRNLENNHKDFKKAVDNHFKKVGKHGILEKNGIYRVNMYKLGSFATYEEAAIMRNAYVINNNIDKELAPLDIPIEEQLERSKHIKNYTPPTKKRPFKNKDTYKGLATSIYTDCTVEYKVWVHVKGKSKLVGRTNDAHIGAMMYNLYALDNGLTDIIVNDVGLDVEEQRKAVRNAGYIYNGNSYVLDKRKYTKEEILEKLAKNVNKEGLDRIR